jgi:hypothetical protein
MPGLRPGSPSSWRDYSAWLTFAQIRNLQRREHEGFPPQLLFLDALKLAVANLDD